LGAQIYKVFTKSKYCLPGFPQHPNCGFETVSIILEELIDHADSLGEKFYFIANKGRIIWERSHVYPQSMYINQQIYLKLGRFSANLY